MSTSDTLVGNAVTLAMAVVAVKASKTILGKDCFNFNSGRKESSGEKWF